MTPSSGLHNGEVVTVSGTHLGPGERVNVRECWSDLSACAGFDGTGAYASGSGSFRTQLPVSSTVWLSQCGSNHCVVRVQRENGTALLVPIAFG